jgi:serine/threonine-protein kinase RsbW
MWFIIPPLNKIMSTETLIFNAEVDELEPIRDFVTEKALAAGADNRKNYALCLAIDEIATNIMRYGYPLAGITDGKIDVTITVTENTLTIILEDGAVPFNPMQHMLPTDDDLNKPLEDRPIGGLGIMLAQQSVDDFKYEYVNNKNRNIFIVNI